jgi:hypothetical protein
MLCTECPAPRRGNRDIAAGLDFAYSAPMSAAIPAAPPWRRRLGLVAVAALVFCGCRFMPKGAHWIEGHGGGRALRIAGRPAGVMAIGMDGTLFSYPTDYAHPWRLEGPQQVREIASSLVALYAIGTGGDLWRVSGGQWAPYAGSVAWGATAIAASDDDHLFVVVGGKSRRVDGSELKDAPCGDVAATAMAAATADEIYVIDASGGLHHGVASGCTLVTTPGPLRNVAVSVGRLVVVTTAGSVWRRRGEETWRALPVAREYRSGAYPLEVLAAQVTLSANSTWLLDQAGSVFVLSDET